MTTNAMMTLDAANVVLPSIKWFADLFKPDEEIHVEWTSPQFMEVSLFGGWLTIKRGERRSFIVRGKPGFCQAGTRSGMNYSRQDWPLCHQ